MLYELAINQSDCTKACPYQLAYNNDQYTHRFLWRNMEIEKELIDFYGEIGSWECLCHHIIWG